jgi:hypothetical protein
MTPSEIKVRNGQEGKKRKATEGARPHRQREARRMKNGGEKRSQRNIPWKSWAKISLRDSVGMWTGMVLTVKKHGTRGKSLQWQNGGKNRSILAERLNCAGGHFLCRPFLPF